MGKIFLVIIHLLLICWIATKVYRRFGEGVLKPLFFPALLLKLIAGIFLGVVFKYYYAYGDTWALFDEATILANHGYKAPASYLRAVFQNDYSLTLRSQLLFLEQPRALFAAKIISLFNIVTANHYWLVSLYLSSFSFISFWLLARKLAAYFPKTTWASGLAFLFFPSVVFWSAGVSKESLVMGGLCCALASLLPLLVKNEKLKVGHWVLVTFGLLLVVLIKYYYAAILIPILIVSVVTGRLRWKPWPMGFAAIALLGILLAATSWFHPNLHLGRVFSVVIQNGQEMTAKTSGQGCISFFNLTPDLKSVALNFPWAVFSGLFRPSLLETKTIFQLGIGLENAVILILALSQIIYWKKPDQAILVWAAIIYIALLAGFLALSAPNFGTLVRYKIGFWPLFVYLVFAANPWLKKWTQFAQ